MSKHIFTTEEKIRGVRKALESRKTPGHFRAALKRHLRILQGQLTKRSLRRRRKKPPTRWPDWLGF